MSIAACIHRLRRAARRLARRLPGIRHHIAAARKARLTRHAHAYGDAMREKMRAAR